MTDATFDRVAEVFLALTTRWRTPRGVLGIGVPRAQLSEALGGEPELDEALATLRGRMVGLGMEVVEYRFESDQWYCLRSVHVAPTELAEDQQGVLGVIIMLIETDDADGDATAADAPATRKRRRALDGDQPRVAATRVADLLTGGGPGTGYLSRSRLDDILRELETAGYIVRRSRHIQYGPRLFVEFPDDARLAIAEQAGRLIS
ncbi:MAG: hypothetical protein AB7K09_20765 [Planctomycetota bacterium]